MKVGNPNHPLAPKLEEFFEFEDEVDSTAVHCTRITWKGRLEHEQPKKEPEPNGNSGQNPRKTAGHAGNDSGKQAATQTEA